MGQQKQVPSFPKTKGVSTKLKPKTVKNTKVKRPAK